MSSSLMWRPVDQGKCLPDELKFALRKRYDLIVVTLRDTDNLDYIRGLRDAEVKGAQELLNAIEKHGEIELFEEF